MENRTVTTSRLPGPEAAPAPVIFIHGVGNSGLIAAVTAQRAFPFNQRLIFYRNLIGQAQNLYADCAYGDLKLSAAMAVMKGLRLDFAQQFPRGATFNP